MSERRGQCLCGAVRFTAYGMGDTFSTCYCQMCQRWSGGPYRGVSVPSEKLEITGRENIVTIQISSFAERAFCRKCGSGIWWRMVAGPYVGKTSIPIGLLDDRSGLTLSYEMFTDYKDSTTEVPSGTKQMTKAEAEAIIASFDPGSDA